MNALLTPRAVQAARPQRARREIPDGTGLGLYLAIETTGAKTWVHRYRDTVGTPKRRKIGDVSEMTLAAARAAVAAARVRIEQGAEPPTTPPSVSVTGDRIEEAVAQFLELHARRKNRPSTAWAAERIFNRIVLPAWRGRSIHDVKRRDVITLVEHVASDRPYLANRTLGVLSKFFNWLCARDMIAVSPVIGVERPCQEEVRERTLSDDELRALWRAAEGDGPFGQALKVLVLTGTRRNEVSRLRWQELDGPKWTLPAVRSKNGREHVVTLSAQAQAIIEAQPHFAGCDYVFSADGHSPIVGWAKAKTRLSAKAGIAEKGWRLHDLRRTAAAGMQRLGIRSEAIERALNHRSGIFRGLVSVYQTDRLDDECAVALQRWADRIDEIVGGKPAKVVKLRRR